MKILNKNVTNETIKQQSRILRKHGIKFSTYNMLGLPTESIENAIETIKINKEIQTDYPHYNLFQPFKGTVIYDYCIKNGLLEKTTFLAENMTVYQKIVINLKNKYQYENLMKLAFCVTKLNIPISIVKLIIKLPPNLIFDFIFLVVHVFETLSSRSLGVLESLKLGIRYIKTDIFRKVD